MTQKTARDLQKGNRFTYRGAFTIYVVQSDPQVEECLSGFVRFKAVDENWGPERDLLPMNIRLRSDLEVEVLGARSRTFQVVVVVEDDGHVSDFNVRSEEICIAVRGLSRGVASAMLSIGGIIQEDLKRRMKP